MIGLKNEIIADRQKEILLFIEKNPGTHLREVQRRLSISSMGNLEYHIHKLYKLNLIVEKKVSGYKRYYPFKRAVKNKELLALMRQKIPRRIALLILEKMRKKGNLKIENKSKNNISKQKTISNDVNDFTENGLTPFELMGELGLSPSALSYYLSKMRNKGILTKEKQGKNVFYIARNPEELLKVIILYRESFMDNLVNSFMETWGL